MADDTPKAVLPPEELATMLETLDRVMEEAARLRREVTRQLSESRQRDQQRLSTRRKKGSAVRR